jgi:hypothetical protein
MLIARISATAPCVALPPASLQSYETLPLACPVCEATMRIIAFITETAPVHRILDHIGELHQPPLIHPPRKD